MMNFEHINYYENKSANTEHSVRQSVQQRFYLPKRKAYRSIVTTPIFLLPLRGGLKPRTIHIGNKNKYFKNKIK